jgi:hypothetical protein
MQPFSRILASQQGSAGQTSGATGLIRLGFFLACLLVIGVVSERHLEGQEKGPPTQSGRANLARSSVPIPLWANRGPWVFAFQLGYAVENASPRNISHINLLIAQPQLALIVRDFQASPVRRFEIVDEGILGNSVHPGGQVLGNSLLFRFDGKPYRRIVPFLDLGAGVLYTTLGRRAPELSGHLQFLPQAGLGVQYFFKPQRALVFEYRYVHMSNAGVEPPKLGFNASMLTIGFRWLRWP